MFRHFDGTRFAVFGTKNTLCVLAGERGSDGRKEEREVGVIGYQITPYIHDYIEFYCAITFSNSVFGVTIFHVARPPWLPPQTKALL